ncbi:hypothetical protein HK100_010035 [Physocladia obscura]|uniref:Peptidase S59 domain-containing protein n=1 Tax=Physocladia obscura TaxID=109957 RepID=A0AAD5T3K1_9FUNG|nr:hypothetical protein HK100_010035 [Physocladia obscura]
MFGGFGSTPASTFGAPQQQPQQQGGGLFGVPATGFGTQTPAFGAQPGAFGAAAAQQQPQANAFGFGVNTSFGAAAARPAFGGTQSTTTAAPGGLFGQPAQPQQQQTFGFGSATGGGLFGSAQPAPPTGGFGAPSATSFGFGGQAQTAATPSFGPPGQTTPTNNFGTGSPAYAITQEREPSQSSNLGSGAISNFISISAAPNYKNWNFEELRVQDYIMGKKFSTTGPGTGSTFGAPAQTGFGTGTFGAATAPTQTGGLFGTSAQTGGFGFGATAPSTGVFGSTATTPSLFGGAATSTFGSTTSTAGAFGQPAASSTGFGFGATGNNPKPAGFGGFGTSTSASAFGNQPLSGFGSAAQPPASTFGQSQGAGAFGTGLFASKPATSTFGGPAQTATPSVGFGTALGANNASSGGLFGSTSTTVSPFGATSTTPMFGSTLPQQSNLFGAPSSTSAVGTFGSTTHAASGLGGTGFGGIAKPVLFGSTQPAQSPGFGGFGQSTVAPTAGTMFSGTGGFGPTQAQTAANFGTSVSFGASTSGGGLLGGSSAGGNSFFGNSMFGPSTVGAQSTQQTLPSLHASIDSNPYGNNPLFTASTKSTAVGIGGPLNANTAGPALFAPPEEKKQIIPPHYKMTPKSASKIKLRGFTPSRVPSDFFNGIGGNGSGNTVVGTASSSAGLPKSVLGLLKDDSIGDALSGSNYSGSFKPRVKKLIISEEPDANVAIGVNTVGTPAKTQNGNAVGSSEVSSASSRTVRFLDETISSVRVPVIDVTGSAKKAPISAQKPPFVVATASSNGKLNGKSSPHRSPSVGNSSNGGAVVYETEPPIDELMKLSDVELTHVDSYTVILPGVGKVKFLEPVNLLQASPTGTRAGIANIPGTVVILKHKAIEVYPDEDEKDPAGMGVNVPAEVSLDRCWVIDKRTGNVIDDDTDPKFDKHFKRLESIEGTKMLGFNKATGTWRFRVEHFSKYGFDEEDDGDINEGQIEEFSSGNVPHDGETLKSVINKDDDYDDYDEDDEPSFMGNDSFAHVKSRKVLGLPTSKVRDLRRFATQNLQKKSLEFLQQQQRQHQQEQQNQRQPPILRNMSALDDMEEEDEEVEIEENQDFEEAEEEEDEEEDEAMQMGGDILDESLLKMSTAIHESNDQESNTSANENVIANVSLFSQDRKINVMRSALFQSDMSPTGRSFCGVPGSNIGAQFFSASSKRGIESVMDYESSSSPSLSKLNPINVSQEFLSQTPSKPKRDIIPAELPSIQSLAKDEHVVPVVIKKAVGSVVLASPMQSIHIPHNEDSKSFGIVLPPLKDSIVNGRESYCVDAGLFMGRSSRVGWGPGGKFVVSGRSRFSDSFSHVNIETLNVFSWQNETDTKLRECLAEFEVERHVKSLESIINGTLIALTESLLSSTTNQETNRVIVDESFTPAKSMLQSVPQCLPVCPIALIDKTFNFSTLQKTQQNPLASASNNDIRRTFIQQESSVWTLASALFDPVVLPSNEKDSLPVDAMDAVKEAVQKEAVSEWLRKFSESPMTGNSGNRPTADVIYTHLLARRVSSAVQTALRTRDFRLATLLSQIGGVSSKVAVISDAAQQSGAVKYSGHGVSSRSSTFQTSRNDISEQIIIWTQRPHEKTEISPDYLRLWRLISGNISLWDDYLVGGASNWKQTLGIFLWYSEGGGVDLKEAIEGYDFATKSKLNGKHPLPWYIERNTSSPNKKPALIKKEVKDVCYSLLKLHTDRDYLLESAILPCSIGPNILDHRVSWLLWLVLSRAKHLREFLNHGNIVRIYRNHFPFKNSEMVVDDVDSEEDAISEADETISYLVSRTADLCTASFCYTLESLGLWKWALFVGLFLSTQNGREALIRDILARWYPLNDTSGSVGREIQKSDSDSAMDESEDWKFVVSTLKIPSIWIHEAKVIRAKYIGNVYQECISLIDAKRYNLAHQLAILFLSPMELINESYKKVESLLRQIVLSAANVQHIENWSLGGGFLLDCIEVFKTIQQKELDTFSESEFAAILSRVTELLEVITKIQTKKNWLVEGLGSRMDQTALEDAKKQWFVCLSEISARLVAFNAKIDGIVSTDIQISGDLLRLLPLTEDVRGKYASNVIQKGWYGVV